jgi:hypothetical protein
MTAKDVIKPIVQGGMKIAKNTLVEALRRTSEREFYFVKDSTTGYAAVRIPMPE